MRLLLALLLLPVLLVHAQEQAKPAEKKPKKKQAGDLVIPDPGTPIEDSSVARREVARFQTDWRKAESDEDRVKLLQRLGKWDHPEIMKAAAKHINHKSFHVAVAAVVVVARQSKDKDKAGALLLKALRREKRTDVICALLIGMGKLGYDKKNAIKEAISYFRKGWKERHKAAIRYLGYIKHKESFRMLAEVLDEPKPLRPDDPRNPPESYWKERWYDWNEAVPYVRWALSQMVPGETFDQMEEAKQWVENHGKEHGISW